jgi:predicted deacetylase
VKVAIRDDDTSYFTRAEALERLYHDVWDRVPVCLATVPFAVGYQRQGIPEEHWQSGISFPLAQNGEVVAFLKEAVAKKRVTIALHGYTHQDYPDGYEFQAAPDPERRVAEGHRYLTSALGVPITIFVPPHNALSKRGLAAISAAGLNLLGSFLSFRPSMRPWEASTLVNWWRVWRYRARTGRTRADRFVYPFPLRYARHAEFGCHSLIPGTTLEELIAGFDEARQAGGDFCLATHYWEVDARMKDVLQRFLDHASRTPGVEFVPCEALFSRS